MISKQSAISYITLGVIDLEVMHAFYSGLGFDVYKQSDDAEHPYVMYQSGALILALYPKHLLAKQSGVLIEKDDQNRAMSISLNLGSKDAVITYLDNAKRLNATITQQGFEPEWGGFCGYFKDPENNLWELAWHPKLEF